MRISRLEALLKGIIYNLLFQGRYCALNSADLEEVAKGMDAEVDVVKVDIEATADNTMLASEYEVRSIPNMNVFKGGKVVDTIIGMVPQASLEASLKKHV